VGLHGVTDRQWAFSPSADRYFHGKDRLCVIIPYPVFQANPDDAKFQYPSLHTTIQIDLLSFTLACAGGVRSKPYFKHGPGITRSLFASFHATPLNQHHRNYHYLYHHH
jgi:hypothetical protein